MKCIIPNRFYMHHQVCIFRDEQGVSTSLDLKLFPTFADAKRYIDIIFGYSNDRPPKIIGAWKDRGMIASEQAEQVTWLDERESENTARPS